MYREHSKTSVTGNHLFVSGDLSYGRLPLVFEDFDYKSSYSCFGRPLLWEIPFLCCASSIRWEHLHVLVDLSYGRDIFLSWEMSLIGGYSHVLGTILLSSKTTTMHGRISTFSFKTCLRAPHVFGESLLFWMASYMRSPTCRGDCLIGISLFVL